MSNPATEVPAKIRYVAYWVYWVTGLVLSSITVWYTAIPDTGSVPSWVVRAIAVLGFLSVPFGFTAASNMNSQDTPRPAVKDNPLNDDGKPGEHRR